MLDSLIRVADFYWNEGAFRPPLDLSAERATHSLAGLHGQFAVASILDGDVLALARDKLGINKLFLAIHESGRVLVSNYLADLVARAVPFEAIYSVPAGHVLHLDPAREQLTLRPYFRVPAADSVEAPPQLDAFARAIRAKLDLWFSRLAAEFSERQVCICLSGGLDSSLIAAFAARYFPSVTAYSYGYFEAGRPVGDDAGSAARVAEFLGLPFRLVSASATDLIGALDEAVCYGQDWRDFNVHCAVVNALLARAIDQDARNMRDRRPLVLSGDLMNEFVADYSPVSFNGREYYKLPKLPHGRLRAALVRGLDAGDREVGIFNHHGLDLIQPYGLLADEYLRLPGAFLASDRCKQVLARAVADDLLPPFVFGRQKVRAQIGTAGEPTGILPVLAAANRDGRWLKTAFCRTFGVNEESFLDRFVRLGVYRFPRAFPQSSGASHGYLS